MKNKLLFLLLLSLSFKGLAQDPELLSTTWYFNEMIIDDVNHVPNFEEYFYYIALIFDDHGNNLGHFWTEACERLGSEITYQNNTEFNLSNLSQSSESCESDFEEFKTLYFNFFYNNQENSFTYEIFNIVDDKTLIITDLFGNKVYYSNVVPINTLLDQTWELTHIYLDLDGEIIISNVDPPISPTVTFNENLEYTGFGSCNSFSGKFITTYQNHIYSVDFEQTTNTCINEEHTTVENIYFGYFSGNVESYAIQVIDNNQFLYLIPTPHGYYLKFKSTNNLGSEKFINSKIDIYPNPVSDRLFISSDNNIDEKIIVYSIFGSKVLEPSKNQYNSIDVSSLSKGIYFIELSSSEGKSIKQFIKE